MEQKEYRLRPNHGVRFDRPIEKIEPLGNEIVVTGPVETRAVDDTEILELGGEVGVTLSAAKTARVLVTFTD